MKQVSCPREAEVSRASRTGEWHEALKAHAAACPVCGEVALVGRSMRMLARASEDRRPLPDFYLVWLKAKLTDRRMADERASKQLTMAESLGQGAVAVVLTGWLVWKWPAIHQKLAAWMPSSWYSDWAAGWSFISSTLSVPPSFIFWATIGVICLVALLAAEPLFAED